MGNKQMGDVWMVNGQTWNRQMKPNKYLGNEKQSGMHGTRIKVINAFVGVTFYL